MCKLSWMATLAWALAGFFTLGSAINIAAPNSVTADYERWGYPDWFHYVTGGLELMTAILLAVAATRLWGATLGGAVMLAATATVVIHGEYTRVFLPILILLLVVVVGYTAPRTGLPNRDASGFLSRK
jgi:chromate transport protein ChrA